MSSVNKFIASFASNTGIALGKSNRFMISGIDNVSVPGGDLSMLIRDVTLPGKSLSTHVYRNIGTPYKLPYDITYPEVTLSFYDTETHDVRAFYSRWLRQVYQDSGDILGYGYYDSYTHDMEIHQLSSEVEDTTTFSLKLIRSYPIAISDMTFSQDSSNAINKIDITMMYERWEEKLYNKTTTVSLEKIPNNILGNALDKIIDTVPFGENIVKGTKSLTDLINSDITTLFKR